MESEKVDVVVVGAGMECLMLPDMLSVAITDIEQAGAG
jgi:hypothetical protein